MRKMISVLTVAAMPAFGLVALSGGASSAGEPYPGSVDTTCFGEALNNPVAGNPAKVRFRVGTGGNGAAKGWATFSYERRSNGVVVEEFKRRYEGPGWDKHLFEGVPRGKYKVKVFFDSRPNDSVYQNCRTSFTQRVRPRG